MRMRRFDRLVSRPGKFNPRGTARAQADREDAHELPRLGIFEKARCGAIPLLVLRSPPLRLTLGSGEAAYRRAKFTTAGEMGSPILRYGAYAPTQDEGSGCLLGMRVSSVLRSPVPRGGSIPTNMDFFNNPT